MSWHFTPWGIENFEANTANLNVQYGTFPITGVFTFSQGASQDREMKLTYNQNMGLSSNPYSYGESPTSPMTMTDCTSSTTANNIPLTYSTSLKVRRCMASSLIQVQQKAW